MYRLSVMRRPEFIRVFVDLTAIRVETELEIKWIAVLQRWVCRCCIVTSEFISRNCIFRPRRRIAEQYEFCIAKHKHLLIIDRRSVLCAVSEINYGFLSTQSEPYHWKWMKISQKCKSTKCLQFRMNNTKLSVYEFMTVEVDNQINTFHLTNARATIPYE